MWWPRNKQKTTPPSSGLPTQLTCSSTIKFRCASYKARYLTWMQLTITAIRNIGYYTASFSPTTPNLWCIFQNILGQKNIWNARPSLLNATIKHQNSSLLFILYFCSTDLQEKALTFAPILAEEQWYSDRTTLYRPINRVMRLLFVKTFNNFIQPCKHTW